METLEGRQIGQWIIEREVGRGSMGAVYRAHHYADPNNVVAVKILLAALATDPSFITRFTRETEALRKMRHPNVIRIVDYGQDGSMLYYVMEYINGKTAGAMLKQVQRIGVLQTIEIGAQVADALDYIHAVGQLVHRDIKPDNIMVDRWYRAKVLDFGLARIDGAYTITRAGMVVGSLYYVPPEHLRGDRIDGRADIYALGVSLYEMVTGERPFRGKTLQEMSRAIAGGNPVPPSLLEPTVPLEFERIILKALARRRDDRYVRAGEMRDDLRALQQQAMPPGADVTGPPTLPMPTPEAQQMPRFTRPQPQYGGPDPRQVRPGQDGNRNGT